MIATKNLLNDETTSAEVKAAILAAWRDPSAVRSAELVRDALRTLVDAAAVSGMLQEAAVASLEGGASVVDQLREREFAIRAQVNAALAERTAYKAQCAAREREVQPLLNRCVGEILALGGKNRSIEIEISQFDSAREAAKKRYEKAGFSAEEIEAIGIKPTSDDLSAMKQELVANRERQAQLEQFIKSAPEYPEHLLHDIKAEV
jgi:hypothetical protein